MLGGRPTNKQAQEDAAVFGLPQQALEDMASSEAESFDVEPENWPIVQLWCQCQTQWRPGPSRVMGLDYVAVDVVMKRLSVDDTSGDVFLGLQAMELAALRAMEYG